MTFQMVQSKIHRATITDAHLDYIGSITIGKKLIKASGLLLGQKVDIVDINNGERFSTYVIIGEDDNEIKINGAAARKVQVGDLCIIIGYAGLDKEELAHYKPNVVLVDEKNEITQIVHELKG
ncbi:MAG: Aspartate 1-decarboxylase (EC [uncultured Campylobacterales bacterium]|uniref:Aspartate 1-decarboxylase n=1 Tax=uncultured Campylobacterales bacterium TaxID=352960 RepID=A0A6S6S7N8_9BACT|nr:MAG: Aspartate 1-decarboxylase (EC [uncultured Campylobacterales bacterium]